MGDLLLAGLAQVRASFACLFAKVWVLGGGTGHRGVIYPPSIRFSAASLPYPPSPAARLPLLFLRLGEPDSPLRAFALLVSLPRAPSSLISFKSVLQCHFSVVT